MEEYYKVLSNLWNIRCMIQGCSQGDFSLQKDFFQSIIFFKVSHLKVVALQDLCPVLSFLDEVSGINSNIILKTSIETTGFCLKKWKQFQVILTILIDILTQATKKIATLVIFATTIKKKKK